MCPTKEMVKRRHKVLYTVLKYLAVFTLGFLFSNIYFSNMELCEQSNESVLPDLKQELSEVKNDNSLVVIIFSAPDNNIKRQAIRKTWLLTKKDLEIRHFFVIGFGSLSVKQKKLLLTEKSQFKDLLLLEKMSDSFSKLSNKLLQVFIWLDAHVKFTYLLKVDDDSFVQLDKLHLQLMKQPTERLYWGFFNGNARVFKKGKWQEKKWFLCDHYLPYALGGGYVLSRDLVHNIVLMFDYLTLYQNEDVSLGTWLSPFHIQRLHDPQFDTEYISRGCNNSYLITHKQSTAMMVSKYNNLQKFGRLCMSEYKSRNSYIYDWEVPPSQCCSRNDSSIS